MRKLIQPSWKQRTRLNPSSNPVASMARPAGTPGVGSLAEVINCPRISPPGLLGSEPSSKL